MIVVVQTQETMTLAAMSAYGILLPGDEIVHPFKGKPFGHQRGDPQKKGPEPEDENIPDCTVQHLASSLRDMPAFV
jgi:hypothetical protein